MTGSALIRLYTSGVHVFVALEQPQERTLPA